jgi:hypothetical protein
VGHGTEQLEEASSKDVPQKYDSRGASSMAVETSTVMSKATMGLGVGLVLVDWKVAVTLVFAHDVYLKHFSSPSQSESMLQGRLHFEVASSNVTPQ